MTRHAGALVPLFSAWSRASWGLGELADIAPLAGWLAEAGFDRLLLLPIGTVTAGETSPYSAASAMAIDPIYIALEDQEDFVRAGGLAAMRSEDAEIVLAARHSPRVRYDEIRQAKIRALDHAFARFLADEWELHTARAAGLAAYVARERWWLDDHALYQALAAYPPGHWWPDWEAPLRDRDQSALDEARRRLAPSVLRQQYWQWIAETQWQQAREAAHRHGVRIFGDLPFMVSAASADVWSRQDEFRLDVSVGVPPDAFSDDGQDWGLPLCRWEVIGAGGFEWIRQRVRRTAALFDGVRVDHLVGLYRTYGRPRGGGKPFFLPATETEQRRQGEQILQIFVDSGMDVVAEDLGTVPDFVRESLDARGVPGCKVLRWERAWHTPGRPFVDPATYRARSAVMTGTHDTETHADWWDRADPEERAAIVGLPVLERRAIAPEDGWSDELRDALLQQTYQAGSDELFVPIQDVFGWRDRVNTPGTVDDRNWTWKLPWPIDTWSERLEAGTRAAFCRALADQTARRVPLQPVRAPGGDRG